MDFSEVLKTTHQEGGIVSKADSDTLNAATHLRMGLDATCKKALKILDASKTEIAAKIKEVQITAGRLGAKIEAESDKTLRSLNKERLKEANGQLKRLKQEQKAITNLEKQFTKVSLSTSLAWIAKVHLQRHNLEGALTRMTPASLGQEGADPVVEQRAAALDKRLSQLKKGQVGKLGALVALTSTVAKNAATVRRNLTTSQTQAMQKTGEAASKLLEKTKAPTLEEALAIEDQFSGAAVGNPKELIAQVLEKSNAWRSEQQVSVPEYLPANHGMVPNPPRAAVNKVLSGVREEVNKLHKEFSKNPTVDGANSFSLMVQVIQAKAEKEIQAILKRKA